MKTRVEIEAEIFRLLTDSAGPTDEQIRHRGGRLRALVWVLSGKDVGYTCTENAEVFVETLGWEYRRQDGLIHFQAPDDFDGVRHDE